MSKLKPLSNRVLIKRSKPQQKKGGILLPDSVQEKPKEGDVVAVGPGKLDEEGTLQKMNVKVGDRVLFGSYAGTEVKNSVEEDAEFLIMSEDDILGVLS